MLRERFQRTLAVSRVTSRAFRTILFFAFLAAIALGVFVLGRSPDLSHMKVTVLSGSPSGNYHAVVQKLAAEAKRQRGRVENRPSAGSVENIRELAAGRASCKVQFALVQEGVPWPEDNGFELIGRLPRPESLVLVGRNADDIRRVRDLRGKRIGIGPAGSGTTYVARRVLTELAGLDIQASQHPLDEQLAMVESGELDLAAMIIDADAKLLTDAVRERNLQIVDIASAEALANRLPFARVGRIEAGHYDPSRQLPPADKHVIQIDTLVIGNGCARESAKQGFITTLVYVFPEFLRVNTGHANLTGLPLATAARSYYDRGGPDPVGAYAPWVIDIMPTARWVQLAFVFSFLFAAQAVLHRFRLWRIDALRVQIEADVTRLLGAGVTVGEIAGMPGDDRLNTPKVRAQVDAIVARLDRLARRCRRHSLSIMVPMGQEMGYRYQESLIADLVHALRIFRRRIDRE